jgi:hypothetical protein
LDNAFFNERTFDANVFEALIRVRNNVIYIIAFEGGTDSAQAVTTGADVKYFQWFQCVSYLNIWVIFCPSPLSGDECNSCDRHVTHFSRFNVSTGATLRIWHDGRLFTIFTFLIASW